MNRLSDMLEILDIHNLSAFVKYGKALNNTFLCKLQEIYACSLARFYGQYADRQMNLKFVRHVGE